MIELLDLTKRFGSRLAVDRLTLRVARGEIYGLLGHNGAGKSTTIGMMLGQVWASSGTVRICGHSIATERSRALKSVGAIFESPAFYDYLTGWRNLQILSSYTAPTPPDRIREVLDWVGLSGREHSKVRTYSHGMRARLALAQALLPHPDLLILDEPSDGLDPEGIHEMRTTIKRLHQDLGLTILLSSHFLTEVQQLCTRIAVLRSGSLVFEGSVSEARQGGRWLKLGVDDFANAVAVLKARAMVSDHRDGQYVALTPETGPELVSRVLVESGISLYEICRHEQTLEDFYMALMQRGPGAGVGYSKTGVGVVPRLSA